MKPPLKADPAPARRARAPLFKIFYGCIFGNFDFITRINFIVFTICILFITLTTKTKGICVKGHQKNLQTSKIIPRRDRSPPPLVLKFLDPPLSPFQFLLNKSNFNRNKIAKSGKLFGKLLLGPLIKTTAVAQLVKLFSHASGFDPRSRQTQVV